MTSSPRFKDRPLIDKYGHRHSAAVLTNWSPLAIKALGIRKVPTPETEHQPGKELASETKA